MTRLFLQPNLDNYYYCLSVNNICFLQKLFSSTVLVTRHNRYVTHLCCRILVIFENENIPSFSLFQFNPSEYKCLPLFGLRMLSYQNQKPSTCSSISHLFFLFSSNHLPNIIVLPLLFLEFSFDTFIFLFQRMHVIQIYNETNFLQKYPGFVDYRPSQAFLNWKSGKHNQEYSRKWDRQSCLKISKSQRKIELERIDSRENRALSYKTLKFWNFQISEFSRNLLP